MLVIEQESMDYLRFLLYLGKRKRISYLRDNEMGQDKILNKNWAGRDGTGREKTVRDAGQDGMNFWLSRGALVCIRILYQYNMYPDFSVSFLLVSSSLLVY